MQDNLKCSPFYAHSDKVKEHFYIFRNKFQHVLYCTIHFSSCNSYNHILCQLCSAQKQNLRLIKITFALHCENVCFGLFASRACRFAPDHENSSFTRYYYFLVSRALNHNLWSVQGCIRYGLLVLFPASNDNLLHDQN